MATGERHGDEPAEDGRRNDVPVCGAVAARACGARPGGGAGCRADARRGQPVGFQKSATGADMLRLPQRCSTTSAFLGRYQPQLAAVCCVVDKRCRCGRRGPPDHLPGRAVHRGPHRRGRHPADGRSPGTESAAQPARSRELIGYPPAPGLVADEAVTASVMGVRRFPLASQGLDADAGVDRADDALGDPPHLDQARLIPIFDTPHDELPVRPPRPVVAAAEGGRQRRSAQLVTTPRRHPGHDHDEDRWRDRFSPTRLEDTARSSSHPSCPFAGTGRVRKSVRVVWSASSRRRPVDGEQPAHRGFSGSSSTP